MVDRSPILALLLLSHAVAVSETSVPPSYRGKMRIPISLRTAEGTNLEKGPYLLEVKREEGRHVLVFFVGEEVRTQVSETTPEVSTIWAAEILVVGAHYMRSSADPIGTALERQFSKTGLPRYQEEKREWKATLRVYRSPADETVFFLFQEHQEPGRWKKVYFQLFASDDLGESPSMFSAPSLGPVHDSERYFSSFRLPSARYFPISEVGPTISNTSRPL